MVNLGIKIERVSKAVIANDHNIGTLKATEIYFLTVLEARSIKSSCQQGPAFSKRLQKRIHSLPLLTCMAISILWLSLQNSDLCLSLLFASSSPLWTSLSLSNLPSTFLLKNTGHWIREHPKASMISPSPAP